MAWESLRRRAASLVGTLRPGRESPNQAVAGSFVAGLARQKLFSSLLLTHRRQREATRRRGSQCDKSLTVSPGPEAFSEGTLEIALVRTSREKPVARLSLAAISRAAGMDDFPLVTRGPPRGPAGNAAGPGRLCSR